MPADTDQQAKPSRVRTKKLYATGVAHPAVFSEKILPLLAAHLDPSHSLILDPFAGVGKIHRLPDDLDWAVRTVGVEIEPEWALNHPRTLVGDALALPFPSGAFDAVVTSPTYGNRMADSHEARDGSIRRSYTHDLGRPLNEKSSGAMQWGDSYRSFHQGAWSEVLRILRPGGRLVLNISDHIRNKKRQHVASWHVRAILELGLGLVSAETVATSRHREGASSDSRVGGELILAFDAPL